MTEPTDVPSPPGQELKATPEEIAEAKAAEAYWTPERIADAVPVEAGKGETGDGGEGDAGGAPSLGERLRAASAFDNRGVATAGVFALPTMTILSRTPEAGTSSAPPPPSPPRRSR
ncbi:hypothetical protein [Streptomyces antibioticus]|uniref:hypothetical protein n=1 Tax=Streptomyces antibioticus TaxID=1890 RepID=UPI0033EFD65A